MVTPIYFRERFRRAEKQIYQSWRAAGAPAPRRRRTGAPAARKNWYEPTQKLERTAKKWLHQVIGYNINGVSEYLYPQVPVPTYIYIDCNVNFKVLKNREDSSDFDDF